MASSWRSRWCWTRDQKVPDKERAPPPPADDRTQHPGDDSIKREKPPVSRMVTAAWPTNTCAVRGYRRGLQGGRVGMSPSTWCPHAGQTPTGVSGLSVNNPIRGRPYSFVRGSRAHAHNPDKNETASLCCTFRPLAGHGGARIKKTPKPKSDDPRHDTVNRIKTAGASGAKAGHSDCDVSTPFNGSWYGPSKTADRQSHHMQGTARILVAGFCSCACPGQSTCAILPSFKRPKNGKHQVTAC